MNYHLLNLNIALTILTVKQDTRKKVTHFNSAMSKSAETSGPLHIGPLIISDFNMNKAHSSLEYIFHNDPKKVRLITANE